MQKKLIAAAVAGAFVAPVAFAQSTVTIGGTIYTEIGRVDTKGTFADGNIFQTPGSELSIKGEENLGGGMSAWFQCNTTFDVRGSDPQGLCGRNSALGLKGGFGNVYVGNWDTPFKRAAGANRIVNETGLAGAAFLLTGGASSYNANATRGSFSRRQNQSISYETPTFNGFSAAVLTTSDNSATGTASGTTAAKPRVNSIGAFYNNGPISLTAAYEKHDKFLAGNSLGNDTGWVLSAGYQIGQVKLGAIYTEQKFEGSGTAVTTGSKVQVWHLAADWAIAGPHGLRAGYTSAGDMKANNGNGVAISPRPAVGTTGQTGAKLWQLGYYNKLSKRTEATLTYVKLDNDNNATYALGGLSTQTAGRDSSAYLIGLRHTF